MNLESEKTENKLYIYGRQPVLEALRSLCDVEKIWMAKDAKGKTIHQIDTNARLKKTVIQRINKNEIQKFVGNVVHQGVAALVSMDPFLTTYQFDKLLQTRPNPLILILDQIQDVHNLGAIIRTAEVAAVDVLVIPEKGTAQINSTVAKTSAGALFNIKMYKVAELITLIEKLKNADVRVYATLPSIEKSIYDADFTKSTAFVIGSEGKGIRKNMLKFCDEGLSIPQYGKTNSLNVSVSTAIVLYEVIRQRHFS